jgi:hypothetical protein
MSAFYVVALEGESLMPLWLGCELAEEVTILVINRRDAGFVVTSLSYIMADPMPTEKKSHTGCI